MAQISLKEKYIGTLIGGCCGDVLGSQTEGMTRRQIVEKFGDMVNSMPEGKLFTDDTEMTLVLARHLVKNARIKTRQLHKEYANEITYKGYSGATRKILGLFKGEDYVEQFEWGMSDCDGAVMRIAPLGLRKLETNDLINEVKEAILFTHGKSADSHASAFIHCKLIRALIDSRFKTREEYFVYILGHAKKHPPLWTKLNLIKYCLGVPSPVASITEELLGHEDTFQIKAIDALCCAYYSFFRFYQEPVKAICFAASMGGDTDTIAKIAGDLCGALYGTSWIPEHWHGMEKQEELTQLGIELYELDNGEVQK